MKFFASGKSKLLTQEKHVSSIHHLAKGYFEEHPPSHIRYHGHLEYPYVPNKANNHGKNCIFHGIGIDSIVATT